MFTLVSWISLGIAFICAFVIAIDEIRHPQKMWIMNVDDQTTSDAASDATGTCPKHCSAQNDCLSHHSFLLCITNVRRLMSTFSGHEQQLDIAAQVVDARHSDIGPTFRFREDKRTL